MMLLAEFKKSSMTPEVIDVNFVLPLVGDSTTHIAITSFASQLSSYSAGRHAVFRIKVSERSLSDIKEALEHYGAIVMSRAA